MLSSAVPRLIRESISGLQNLAALRLRTPTSDGSQPNSGEKNEDPAGKSATHG